MRASALLIALAAAFVPAVARAAAPLDELVAEVLANRRELAIAQLERAVGAPVRGAP